ncbi:MAG: polysaccharide biosynthesis protein [candidate division Zixibacteria bacterium]|nr:polysaccharide biosynthesis protein [candidate division Zixibacteria bacterium]
MSTLTRIGRNVFSNWAGFVIYIVVSFFLSPFMVHHLGNTGYGIWILVGSLTGYLGILDLGLRPAVVKYVARYRALGDDLMVNRVVNTILVIFSSIAGLVVIGSLILSYFSADAFKVPPEYTGQLRVIIIIVGLNVAASFPFGVFSAMLNALQRFDLNNVIQISVFLVRTILLVTFLEFGGGLIAVGLIVLSAGLTEFALKARWCLKINPTLEINHRLASRETFRMIAGFSAYTFIMSIAGRISFQTDAIVIGAMVSAEAITFFSIGSSMMEYLSTLISHMSMTVTPLASGLDATGDNARMRQLLLVGTRYCLLVILPIGCAYLMLGESFISLWMGPQYGPSSSKVLTILMWSYFGYLSQYVAGSVFYGLGKVKNLAFLNLGVALVNIILSVILVKPFGIYGVALGTAIPLTIYGTIIHPIYICRTMKLGLFEYFRESYLSPLLAIIPFAVVIAVSRYAFEINSYGRFALVVGSATMVYAVVAFFYVIEPDHRSLAWGRVKALFSQ